MKHEGVISLEQTQHYSSFLINVRYRRVALLPLQPLIAKRL